MTADESPSWVGAAAPGPAARLPVPASLRAAAGLTFVVAAVECAHIAGRDDLVVGLRVGLMLVVLLQVPLAVLATRRSAAAALGLFVYQVTTVMAAVAGGFGDVRGVLAVAGIAIVVLLLRSLDAFPTPELPRLDR